MLLSTQKKNINESIRCCKAEIALRGEITWITSSLEIKYAVFLENISYFG